MFCESTFLTFYVAPIVAGVKNPATIPSKQVLTFFDQSQSFRPKSFFPWCIFFIVRNLWRRKSRITDLVIPLRVSHTKYYHLSFGAQTQRLSSTQRLSYNQGWWVSWLVGCLTPKGLGCWKPKQIDDKSPSANSREPTRFPPWNTFFLEYREPWD